MKSSLVEEETRLELTLRSSTADPGRANVADARFSLEHVEVGSTAYDFKWNGNSAYLCFHDLVVRDGEMDVDDGRIVAGDIDSGCSTNSKFQKTGGSFIHRSTSAIRP